MRARGAVRKLAMRLRGFHDPAALRRQGLRLGRNVHIGPWTIIDPSHCWLIDIEDEVVIAPRVHILAHDASTDIHLRYAKIGRVRIGRRAFVGAGSIILPGTTIGDDAIIGAGSVVSGEVPAGAVAAGNPARVIGETADYVRRQREQVERGPAYEWPGWTVDTGITDERKERMRDDLIDSPGYLQRRPDER